MTQDEYEFEERAAIKEFDGNLTCEEAEKQAKAELAAQRKAPEQTIRLKWRGEYTTFEDR